MLSFWVEATEDSLTGPLIADTEGRLQKDNWPVWVSDGLDAYGEALKQRHSTLQTYGRTGKVGRPRKPRLIICPQLCYGQVVKERNKNHRVIGVFKRSVYGDVNLDTISTVGIERHNLNLRHENRRLTRKTIAFSKHVNGLKAQMFIYQAYFNFARHHRGLRHCIHDQGLRKWQLSTPAIAAGLTNHIWSLKELMTLKLIINH